MGERWPDLAGELVALKVDAIVTQTTPAALAAKQATSTIPIVIISAIDPVGAGLANSLARPGGNVTGLSSQTADLAGKRLELLREVVPGLRRLAILGNVGNSAAALEMRDVEAMARTFNLEVDRWEIRRTEDIAASRSFQPI